MAAALASAYRINGNRRRLRRRTSGRTIYAYVAGNPVGAVDPEGLYVKIEISFSVKIQAGNPGWALLGTDIGRSQTFGINIPNKWSEWKCWHFLLKIAFIYLLAGASLPEPALA